MAKLSTSENILGLKISSKTAPVITGPLQQEPNVVYKSCLINDAECSIIEDKCLAEVPWFRVRYSSDRYGNACETPCYTSFYADGVHGGVPEWLQSLARRAEKVLGCDSPFFNAYLLRLYKDGSDEISWHTDMRTFLDCPQLVIASFSFGPATRKFEMRKVDNMWSMQPCTSSSALRINGDQRWSWQLSRGDFLAMVGRDTQLQFQHAVLRDLACNDWRININLRHVVPGKRADGYYRFFKYCVFGDHVNADTHLDPENEHVLITDTTLFPASISGQYIVSKSGDYARRAIQSKKSQRKRIRVIQGPLDTWCKRRKQTPGSDLHDSPAANTE